MLFIYLDRLQLYVYHTAEYQGIMGEALAFVDNIKQRAWNIVQHKQVEEWLESPFELPSYVAYADLQFQKIERSDYLLVQNTKQYFLVYIPLTLLFFCLFNRAFYLLFKRRGSLFLLTYSFWLQLWLIAVVQNLSGLWFFCLKELQVLFSFDWTLTLVRWLTVPFVGLVLVCSVSLFPLCDYFYGSQVRYFLLNLDH
jgi:hypothetical protein